MMLSRRPIGWTVSGRSVLNGLACEGWWLEAFTSLLLLPTPSSSLFWYALAHAIDQLPQMLGLSMRSITPCLEIGTSSRDTYRYRGFHRSTSWPTLPAVQQDIKTRGVRSLAT